MVGPFNQEQTAALRALADRERTDAVTIINRLVYEKGGR